jgi:glutathione S-transferase
MAKLKVLGRVTSINVRKVLWLVEELGLEYEREDWGLPLRDPNDPDFLRLNPNAQVPVIVDDGFVLWESNAILRYLADKHGSDLLARDIRQRALVEQWLGWQATDLNNQWGYAFNALARRSPGYDDQARTAASVAGWSRKMEILDGQLAKTGGFVAGTAFSIADVAIGLAVHRWFETPFEHPQLQQVAGYYARLKERKAGERYLTAETP